RTDLRPCRAALARRHHDMGQCRHRLRWLQFVERQPAAAAKRALSASSPGPADDLYAAAERPRLPAQLPARKLAGLSLLGYRARPELAAGSHQSVRDQPAFDRGGLDRLLQL